MNFSRTIDGIDQVGLALCRTFGNPASCFSGTVPHWIVCKSFCMAVGSTRHVLCDECWNKLLMDPFMPSEAKMPRLCANGFATRAFFNEYLMEKYWSEPEATTLSEIICQFALNPSCAEAILIQSTMMQIFLKTIQTLSHWYSLESSCWVLSDE